MRLVVQRYWECEMLLYRASWDWHYRSLIPFNDIYSEALHLFMVAHRKFDKKRGTKFSSYLHIILQTRLQTFCQTEGRERRHISYDALVGQSAGTAKNDGLLVAPKFSGWDWSLRCEELSEESRSVLRLLVHGPAEMLGLDQPIRPKLVRGRIIRELRRRGWQWERIWSTFKELREAAEASP